MNKRNKRLSKVRKLIDTRGGKLIKLGYVEPRPESMGDLLIENLEMHFILEGSRLKINGKEVINSRMGKLMQDERYRGLVKERKELLEYKPLITFEEQYKPRLDWANLPLELRNLRRYK